LKEYIRKARKNHECDYCGFTIKKGEKYRYYEGKWPIYKDLDDCEQIGIEYYKGHTHIKCKPKDNGEDI